MAKTKKTLRARIEHLERDEKRRYEAAMKKVRRETAKAQELKVILKERRALIKKMKV